MKATFTARSSRLVTCNLPSVPAKSIAWVPISEPETMLVHVVMPKVEEVAPAADAAAATAATPAEPEVIKKGKVEKPEEEE